ncbi:hypothetical protein GCM10009660_09160 [Catellatospora bangladeshensis]|uniref:Uncharacterized protein n=1 Tax=Saccharothrix algeriensis TaxID=173560 RepID=A0ABS2S3S3_9PSEU|nr:hypothetical protein [Saccharothrix algeriensis]
MYLFGAVRGLVEEMKESSPDGQAAKEEEERSCSPRMACLKTTMLFWGVQAKSVLAPPRKAW